MEKTPSSGSAEPAKHLHTKRMLGLATLALTTVACKASDIFASPDPVFSFARGAIGMSLIEAELGAGKLLDYSLNKTQSCGVALLSMAVVAVPPILVGVASIEYPAVGYAALAIPIISAFAFLTRRD